MHLFPLPPISPVGFGIVPDCELAEVGGPLLGLPARPEKYWVENSGPIPVAARRTSAMAYLSSEQAGSAEQNRVDTSPVTRSAARNRGVKSSTWRCLDCPARSASGHKASRKSVVNYLNRRHLLLASAHCPARMPALTFPRWGGQRAALSPTGESSSLKA